MEDFFISQIKFLLKENDELEARIESLETDLKLLKQALEDAKSESRKTRFWNKFFK